MDNMKDVLQALSTCDNRRYRTFAWSNGAFTTVSAYESRRGWEVFCWSSPGIPGVDFEDVVLYSVDDVADIDYINCIDNHDANHADMRSYAFSVCKKYALELYETTTQSILNQLC